MYIASLVHFVQVHLEGNKLGLGQGWRTFGTRAQIAREKTSLARCIHFCSIIFNSCALPVCLCCEEHVYLYIYLTA